MSLQYRIDTIAPSLTEPAMPVLRPLDPSFPIERQLSIDAASVVLVNVFTLHPADEQTFLQVWQDAMQLS